MDTKTRSKYHWKDWCWSWNSNTLATWCKELTHWKRPWCWERLRTGGEGDDRGWDGRMASLTQWTWVWVDSSSWWCTQRPGMLWFMRSQSQTQPSYWTELKRDPPQTKGHIWKKGWKNIFHANGDQKKARVAILISNKIDFEIKAMKRDKEGHYIMIKGSIQEDDITIINRYAPNTGALQ